MVSKLQNLKVTELQRELQNIDESKKDIYKIKEAVISHYEDLKRQIRLSVDPNSYFVLTRISNRLNRNDGLQKLISKNSISILSVDTLTGEMDREISMIQDKFAGIVLLLQQRKDFIISRLDVIEKTDLITNILKYKIYEIRYECRKRLDELYVQKQKYAHACEKDMTEMQVAIKLTEIDNMLREEQKNMESQLQSLREQKIEVQLEYESLINTMDIDLDQMTDLYNNLLTLVEEEKLDCSPSDIEILDDRSTPVIDEFRKDIDFLNKMKINGWKTVYSEEKLADVLEARGLKVTKEGLLITESGRLITYREAKESDYLNGVDIDAEKYPQFLEAESVTTKESETTSLVSSEEISRMASEDVQYLKENLGKPLTLALAEITAVQPRDPIHYLGHWLFKFRYNQELDETQKIEIDALNEERDRLAKERWQKFLEEEARAAVMEMIMRAEEQAMKNELRRIAEDMAALEEEGDEDENYEEEAKDVLGEYTGPKTAPKIDPT